MLYAVILVIAAAVFALTALGAFRSEYMIALIVVLYVVVSLYNRRKFRKEAPIK